MTITWPIPHCGSESAALWQWGVWRIVETLLSVFNKRFHNCMCHFFPHMKYLNHFWEKVWEAAAPPVSCSPGTEGQREQGVRLRGTPLAGSSIKWCDKSWRQVPADPALSSWWVFPLYYLHLVLLKAAQWPFYAAPVGSSDWQQITVMWSWFQEALASFLTSCLSVCRSSSGSINRSTAECGGDLMGL